MKEVEFTLEKSIHNKHYIHVVDTGAPFVLPSMTNNTYKVSQEHAYLEALHTILETGVKKEDRTGTGTISLFGLDMRFDLTRGFPLLTTKKVHWKSVVHELLFFIRGSKYSDELEQVGVNIWKEWPGDKKAGTYIPYGAMWRDFGGVDQLAWVIQEIKNNPDSRRLVVSTWNPPERENFVLDPCHTMFQFYVEPLREGETKRRLSCKLTQRSADMFLGVPFNIASYSLLTHLVAEVCDLAVGEFIWSGGDCHIYLNHIEQVKEQLSRSVRPLPTISIHPQWNIDDFTFDDIILNDYNPHPAIKAKVSV